MNDPDVQTLVDIINDEIRLFNRLLESMQEMQRAIVDNDATGIEASVAEQERTAAEAGQCEQRRVQWVQRLAQARSDDPVDASLACLVDLLQGEGGEELGRMRTVLRELGECIRRVSDHNAFLIRQSMRYTERCLDILTGGSPATGMYGQFGRVRRGQGQRTVLNQTV